MYLASKVVVAGLVFALAVNAQSSAGASAVPSSVPGLSQCASACISQAATANGCASFADITCVCTNAQFQLDARECLQNQCPSDLQAALGLQSTECGAAGLSATGSATSDSFSATGISASGSASTSATAPGSGSVLSTASPPLSSGSVISGSGLTSASSSTTSPVSSGSASAASSASSGSTTTGNSATKVEYGYGVMIALVVGLAGAAIGAAL